MTKNQKADAYQIVTDSIIAALDRGVVPWKRPWEAGFDSPRSLTSGKAYRGINTMLLGFYSFTSPWWGTYNQIKKQGGQIRKGEHGTPIVFWRVIEKKDKVTDEVTDKLFLLRYYKVFNIEQADWAEGLPAKVQKLTERQATQVIEPVAATDQMISDYADGPTITRGGSRAFYRPATDSVTLPDRNTFKSGEAEFGTMAHELIHSTGHKSRLGRIDMATYGSDTYAKEELVAEMGAAFLAALYGVTNTEMVEQSAAYIDGWRKAISEDKKLVVSAAGKAQAAVDRIAPSEPVAEEEEQAA